MTGGIGKMGDWLKVREKDRIRESGKIGGL